MLGSKKAKIVANKSSFDHDLTDVSKKKLKTLRATPVSKKKKSKNTSKTR